MAAKLTEKQREIQQIPFRLHRNDFLLMKKLLDNDGLKFQHFVTACVEAFLRGDPDVMRVVRSWREMSAVPKDDREKYTLSPRERDGILDSLDRSERRGG